MRTKATHDHNRQNCQIIGLNIFHGICLFTYLSSNTDIRVHRSYHYTSFQYYDTPHDMRYILPGHKRITLDFFPVFMYLKSHMNATARAAGAHNHIPAFCLTWVYATYIDVIHENRCSNTNYAQSIGLAINGETVKKSWNSYEHTAMWILI